MLPSSTKPTNGTDALEDIDPELVEKHEKIRAERRRVEKLLRDELRRDNNTTNTTKSQVHASTSSDSDSTTNNNDDTRSQRPHADPNAPRFVWRRKREQELLLGVSLEQRLADDQRRIIEAQREIARINEHRELREKEREQRETERLRKLREQDDRILGNWEDYERRFHLDQAKLRAQIRLREHRARPIDRVALGLSLATDTNLADTFQIQEVDLTQLATDFDPLSVFSNCSQQELTDIRDDIQLYRTLETRSENREFWDSMAVVCRYEFETRLGTNHKEDGTQVIPTTVVSDKVISDMQALFANKEFAQLTILRMQLDGKVQQLSSKNDPALEYWTQALRLLDVYRAKALLRERTAKYRERRSIAVSEIERARQEELKRELELKKHVQTEIIPVDTNPSLHAVSQSRGKSKSELPNFDVDDDEDDPMLIPDEDKIHYEPWMSPKPMVLDLDVEPFIGDGYIPVISVMDDFQAVCDSRDEAFNSNKCILNRGAFMKKIEKSNTNRDKQLMSTVDVGRSDTFDDSMPSRGIGSLGSGEGGEVRETGDEEANFGDEISLKTTRDSAEESAKREIQLKMRKYTWQDKYRPRKPKYFNRVHTGYEWNQYNRSHYDTDNPPPKVVQGYKFNIFYPDLIDKSRTPTYTVLRNEANPETAILKFSAGPPYEDIAFQIINREWECVPKRGFKSVFDKGVLQLWFKFKKQRYRR